MTEQNTTVESTTGWAVETLKEWVDQRFADNQTAVNAALLAAKEAVVKSEILTDKRFDAVNETITKVTSQTGDLLPRAEYLANHKALDDKIVIATDAINRSSGDKNLYSTNAFVIQTVNQAISSLEIKMESILTPLVNYVASQKGQSTGSQLTAGRFYTGLVAFSIILGIAITISGIIGK